MALQTGLNFTASDMRNILERNDKQQEGIRTWRQLFGNASLGAMASNDILNTEYSDAIAKAYKANLEQQNRIMGAGLSAGATQSAINLSREELQETYNNYISNYVKNLSTINEEYNTETDMLDDALTERAQNFADLYNSAYIYLSSELFGGTRDVLDPTQQGNPIYDESGGKNPTITGYAPVYLQEDYLDAHNLSWLKNSDGTLRSWNSLSRDLITRDGTLTEKGTLFFNELFNARPDKYMTDGRNIRSFDQWLSEENKDLRDWFVGQDEFNYTFKGTNAGTAKTLVGLDSTADAPTPTDTANIDTDISGDNPLDNYKRDYSSNSDAFKNYKKLYDALQNTPAGIGINANRIRLESEVRKARQNIVDTLTKDLSDMSNSLRTELGNDVYDTFYNANKQAFKELQEMIKALNTDKLDAKMIDEFNNAYQELYKKMHSYINTYKASNSTSNSTSNKPKKPKKPSGF